MREWDDEWMREGDFLFVGRCGVIRKREEEGSE